MKKISSLTFRIYVDADACPVKTETIKIAIRHEIQVFIVSNGGMRPNISPLVKNIIVDLGPDEADNWIFQNIDKNDILITADIPLANKSIKIGAYVISHAGDLIDETNIGQRVASRNLMTEIRSSNIFHQGRGKPYLKSDRIKYINALEKLIQTIKKSL